MCPHIDLKLLWVLLRQQTAFRLLLLLIYLTFLCWLMNLLFNTVSDNPHSRQMLMFPAGNNNIMDILMPLLFTISVLGTFVFDLSNLLNVAAQSATVSYWFHHGCWGRVAGVISARYPRVLWDHVLLFNDTLLREIWPQICMTLSVYSCYL